MCYVTCLWFIPQSVSLSNPFSLPACLSLPLSIALSLSNNFVCLSVPYLPLTLSLSLSACLCLFMLHSLSLCLYNSPPYWIFLSLFVFSFLYFEHIVLTLKSICRVTACTTSECWLIYVATTNSLFWLKAAYNCLRAFLSSSTSTYFKCK